MENATCVASKHTISFGFFMSWFFAILAKWFLHAWEIFRTFANDKQMVNG